MKRFLIIISTLLLSLACYALSPASVQGKTQVDLGNKVCECNETSVYFAFKSDFTQLEAWEQESELNNYFSNTPGYEHVYILMEKTGPDDPYVNMDIYFGDNYWAEERVYQIECSIFKLTIIQKPLVVHNISVLKSGSLDSGNAAISITNLQYEVTYNLLCNGEFLQEIYRWDNTVPVTQQGIYTVQAVVYNYNDYPATIAQGPMIMPSSVSFYHDYAPLAGGSISGPQEYYSGIDNQVVISNLSDATGGNPFWDWAYTYSWEILTNSTWTTLPGETNAHCTVDLYGRWGDAYIRRKVVRGDETAYSNTHTIQSREGSNQMTLNNMTVPFNQKTISFVFDGYYPLSEYTSAENTLKRFFSETHGLQNTNVIVQRSASNDKKVYVEINLGQSNYWSTDKVFHIECNLFKFVLTQTGLIINEVALSKSGSLSQGNATLFVLSAQPSVYYNLFCNGSFIHQFPGTVTSIPVTQQGIYTLEAVVLNQDVPGNPVAQDPVTMPGSISFFYDYSPLCGGTISSEEKYAFGVARNLKVNSTGDPTNGNSFWNYSYSWEVLIDSTWATLQGETGVDCTINLDRFIGDIHIRRKVIRGDETAYSNTHTIKGIDITNQIIRNNMTLEYWDTSISFIYDGYYPLSEYTLAQDILNDLFIEKHGLEGAYVYVERLWDDDRKVYVEINWGQCNYWPEDKVFHVECNLFKFDLTQKGLIVHEVGMAKSGSLKRANAEIRLSNAQMEVTYKLFCNGVFVEDFYRRSVSQEGIYTLEAWVYDRDSNEMPVAQGPIPMSASVSFFLDDVEEIENPIPTLTQNQNYISHFVSHDGGISSGSLNAEYYDGLGRPTQTVQFAATPTKKDLVTFQEYDALGRESNAWLPVVASGNNGGFIQLYNFKPKANETYEYERAPYSFPVYEASPLNRVLEQYGAGTHWHSEKRSVKTSYLTNIVGSDTLNCINYTVTDHITIDTVMTVNHNGNYTNGQLYVIRTADEDGNTSFEFKNKLGQVILTRQLNGVAKETYDTYYIYDDIGNLKVVLPPMASDAMKTRTSWTSNTDTSLMDYAYLYSYNSKNQCVLKKLPGAGFTRSIYDKSNRLIFTQDAKKQWSFSIPDSFGRVVLTGTFENINGSSTILNSDYENSLIVASFDNNGTHNGYIIKKDESTLILGTPNYLVTNYYDNYNFMEQNGFFGLTYAIPTGADAAFDTRDIRMNAPKTLLTGSIIEDADGGTNRIYCAMYYDYRGRMIQSRSINHLGDTDMEYLIYSFNGSPLKRLHIHKKTSYSSEIKELYTYIYDHKERLLRTLHQLNDGNVVTLAENAYDDLGRLKTKIHHGNTADMIIYSYNVRNWLTEIASNQFTQNLYYNTVYNMQRLYNGNVSYMTWKTNTENKLRGYKFLYDNLNRLTEANYGEGENLTNNLGLFTEKIPEYDKHGNIRALQRYGKTSSGYGMIDDLAFGYTGNRMKYVNDAISTILVGQTFNYVDQSNSTADEFIYDDNGNMIKDYNKNITNIQYNVLNLPKKVQFSIGSETTYVYDGAGTKRKVTHQGAGEDKVIEYCGNVIYENGAISKILTEEGYITLSGSIPTYHYFLKDHLGNNRVVLNQNGSTVDQVNHYYPFGGLFEQTTEDLQDYKYNGKELDRTYGLDLYDYSARHMDGALGRFTTMDPMAEKYYSVSPYAYCNNNPVNRIDPDGRDWYQNNETKYYTWYKGDEQREGYTHIGGKGSVLGEFESIIDNTLTDPRGFNTRSFYSEGFTFDIAPNDKGGLVGSKERGWDFFDEFANGVGPEFSVLLSDHPYTEAMKTEKKVLKAQQMIADGVTDVPGQITGVKRDWYPWHVLGTTSMAKQFIGSYRYDAFTSSDGKTLNNVISDSKSRTSLFLHLPFTNQSRNQAHAFSNTYQFYIWKSSK